MNKVSPNANDHINKEDYVYSYTTVSALEEWKPITYICPKCGSPRALFNTMCVLTSNPPQYEYKCSDCGHHWTDFKMSDLGSTQSWPNLKIEEPTYIGQMGWICPKCGGVFAPHMNYCINCTQPKAPEVTCTGLGGIGRNSISDTTINGIITTQSINSLKYESKL